MTTPRGPNTPEEPGLESYLDPATLPYAFCPGCSHGQLLDRLDAALASLQLDPRQVVLVSDIGCAGISDRYFRTHAFHGLHGRSVTYATGIKLAQPELKVIVLIGDGGCGIGGHHLLNAARRNIGLTVVVFNNLNFGMTGGQYSVTTPPGSKTTTTPYGHLEQPLDIAATMVVNGGGFVARTTAFDPELSQLMAQAIAYDGFALLDIWELCVAYYVPQNRFSRRALEEAMTGMGAQPGLLQHQERPEYSRRYRAATAELVGQPTLGSRPLRPQFDSALERPLRLVIAGRAGQRVRTAGTLLATGGVLAGLYATRRDDYPITVRSGFSLAEVILSPAPIHYTGAPQPDVVALLAPEGASRIQPALRRMRPQAVVFAADGLQEVATGARVERLEFPPAARPHRRKSLATLAVAQLVRTLGLYPTEALRQAAQLTQRADIAALTLAAIDSLQQR